MFCLQLQKVDPLSLGLCHIMLRNTRVLDDTVRQVYDSCFQTEAKTEMCLVQASTCHVGNSVRVTSESQCPRVQRDTNQERARETCMLMLGNDRHHPRARQRLQCDYVGKDSHHLCPNQCMQCHLTLAVLWLCPDEVSACALYVGMPSVSTWTAPFWSASRSRRHATNFQDRLQHLHKIEDLKKLVLTQ